MSEAQKEADRRDAFTLSMVDLFGCGFIAAIFLFILNLIQPQVDALADQGSGNGIEGERAAALAGAESGPVFVTVRADREVTFPGWKDAPAARTNPKAADPLDRFVYDHIVPDAGMLQWPKTISLQPVRDPDAPKVPIDAEITMVLGHNVSVVRLVDWVAVSDGAGPFRLAFNYSKRLYASIATPTRNLLSVDLVPNRGSNAALAGQITILSHEPVDTVIGWIGGVDRLIWQDGDQANVGQPTRTLSACWLRYAGKEKSQPDVICPEDNTEISSLVGNKLSRTRAFVRSAGDPCVVPFAGWACEPPNGFVPKLEPPPEWLGPRPCIGFDTLSGCAYVLPFGPPGLVHVQP